MEQLLTGCKYVRAGMRKRERYSLPCLRTLSDTEDGTTKREGYVGEYCSESVGEAAKKRELAAHFVVAIDVGQAPA